MSYRFECLALLSRLRRFGRFLANSGLILGPLFATVMFLSLEGRLDISQGKVASIAVLMAVWWITEAIPLPVTALIPIVLFPLAGVRSIADTTAPYAHPLIFLFLGGFLLALAMQRWHLHRRMALTILSRSGKSPTTVIGGFMGATAFLSMWVSNTATAMLMLPIALSVIEIFKREGSDHSPTALQRERNFTVALMLAIAYGANIGGVGTLIGSPPNALLAAFLRETGQIDLSFAMWLVIGLPVVVVMLPLAWFLLVRVLHPIKGHEIKGGKALIKSELRSMGPMTKGEEMVAAVFAITAGLWLLQPFVTKQFASLHLDDTIIAVAAGLALFALPVDWEKRRFVLDWDSAKQLPWGILLLFGGGLSLAAAIKDTGLSVTIGSGLQGFGDLPLWAIILAIVVVIVFLTEVTSNTATAASFLPVILSLAETLGHPALILTAPAVIASSFAFMMPVATPPNAIVCASGGVTIGDMARAGLLLNIVGSVVILILTLTVIRFVFG